MGSSGERKLRVRRERGISRRFDSRGGGVEKSHPICGGGGGRKTEQPGESDGGQREARAAGGAKGGATATVVGGAKPCVVKRGARAAFSPLSAPAFGLS